MIEDQEILGEHVEEVACRWCGTGRSVEVTEERAPAERAE